MPTVAETEDAAARFIQPLKGKKARKKGAEPDLMAGLELLSGLCVNVARLAELLDGIDTRQAEAEGR